MPLSNADRAILERLGPENVRSRVAHNAGPGSGSVVPGLTTEDQPFGLTRGDVEEWLLERDREAEYLQLRILWWAKAAAVIGIVGIVVGAIVTIGVAFLGSR